MTPLELLEVLRPLRRRVESIPSGGRRFFVPKVLAVTLSACGPNQSTPPDADLTAQDANRPDATVADACNPECAVQTADAGPDGSLPDVELADASDAAQMDANLPQQPDADLPQQPDGFFVDGDGGGSDAFIV